MLTQKYRPKRFADIVGQAESVKVMQSVVQSPETAPRSYIFYGERGVGKTSLAKIFSRALACEGSKVDACLTCDSCRKGYSDFSEASQQYDSTQVGNIAFMRQLKEHLYFSTVSSKVKYRVITFDECLDYNIRVLLDDGRRYRIGEVVSKKIKGNILSYNFDKKKYEFRRITGWFRNSKKEMFRLFLKSKTRGYSILASAKHSFFGEGGKVVELQDLKVGDRVQAMRSVGDERIVDYAEVVGIKKVLKEDYKRGSTYDLEVEGNHNYVANDILVHNCHTISPVAQTALLTLIEEAPRNTFFIFVSTNIEKIISTIRSRSVELPFVTVSDKETGDLIGRIAESEGITLPQSVKEAIVRNSFGFVRDAVMKLDLYLQLGGGEEFLKYMNVPDRDVIKLWLGAKRGDREVFEAALKALLTFPLAFLRRSFEQFSLDIIKVSVGGDVGTMTPFYKEVVEEYGDMAVSLLSLISKDWVYSCFRSDVSFQAFAWYLYYTFSKAGTTPVGSLSGRLDDRFSKQNKS